MEFLTLIREKVVGSDRELTDGVDYIVIDKIESIQNNGKGSICVRTISGDVFDYSDTKNIKTIETFILTRQD